MDLEEIEGLKSLRDMVNKMTLEEIEQRRVPFEGQVSVEQADWLIAEIKRLREENVSARYIINGFLFCIPMNKDWLDPDVERSARLFMEEGR